MHFSRIFIERPVMTGLVTFAILLFGLVGFRALPVAALPSVDYPTVQVTAGLPGASPETMANSVATPLEREFSTIAGVQSMSSSNTQGGTTITIQFGLTRNIDAATQDVQAAVARAFCRQTCRGRRWFRRRIHPNSPSSTSLSVRRLCRSTRWTSTRKPCSRSGFQ